MNYNVAGLELELTYRLDVKGFFRVNYAYADAEGEAVLSTNPKQYYGLERTVPRHLLGLLASRDLSHGFTLSGAYYYVDKTDWYLDGNSIDKYTRFDLRVAKSYKHGNIEFIGQNLGGDYYEFRDVQNPNVFETRAFVRVSFRL
jgi:outer membrane receptor protein involved in Fe transport